MCAGKATIRVLLIAFSLRATGFAGSPSTGDGLVEQGYSAMYNLRFEEAHRVFAQYQQAKPEDPLGPVSDAAACLFSEFDRLHILQSEFVTNYRPDSSARLAASTTVKQQFEQDLKKAENLSAAELQRPQGRANGLFAEALRLGLDADYLALIEKRDLAALAEIKKSREVAQQLVTEHPNYFDAYIAMGIENYLLSQKPAPLRWVLRMSGAETDKQNGLEKLGLTAERGHYLAPYARLLLAVAALRDGNKKKARDLLGWLAARYPNNRLYREELAKLQ